MPEGHTVHRTALQFEKHFAGAELEIDSPQGRFSTSAALISGQRLSAARAIGKQLFLDFESDQTIRIHLGIYGKWTWYQTESARSNVLGEPSKGQVRARFWNHAALAELRGPTVCEVITPEQCREVEKRLGPDPLNPDPRGEERERFVRAVAKSRLSIGLLLMDQSVISGIGNVYRAELLFRAGIDPYTPGSSLPVETVVALWEDSVSLLKVGVKTGFMITRDELFKKRPTKDERNWVYKREGQPCRVCGTEISLALAAARKLYWCSNCQH